MKLTIVIQPTKQIDALKKTQASISQQLEETEVIVLAEDEINRLGLAGTLNGVVQHAQGEYLLLLTAGEEFSTNKSLSQAYQYLKDADCYMCPLRYFNRFGEFQTTPYMSAWNFEFFIQYNIFPSSVFLKIQTLQKYKFGEVDEQLLVWEYVLRICSQHACTLFPIDFSVVTIENDRVTVPNKKYLADSRDQIIDAMLPVWMCVLYRNKTKICLHHREDILLKKIFNLYKKKCFKRNVKVLWKILWKLK